MNMRVTQSALARSALASVRRATSEVVASQEQIATGRRINRPSDAPLDAAHAQRLHSYANRLAQYDRNLRHAQNQLEFTWSAAQGLSDIFVEAREICLRGADAATDPAERELLAVAADQLLDSLIRRANATFSGRYIFAGSADDTQPFEGVLGSDGYIEQVAYHGNDGAIEVQVGSHIRLQVNEPGLAVFAGAGTGPSTFDALIELRDLLRNTQGLTYGDLSNALSDHVGQLREAHETVVDATSRVGWRASQLEFARTTLENVGLASAELLSSLEDADLAGAAAKLYSQQAALEAALVISARMLKNSLLEYL
jgi:flagellar hook-associated protein 3 FlgL